MPAKRKTKEDRIRERFARMYKVGKAETGLRDSDVADLLGITVRTLLTKRKEPKEFSFGQFVVIATAFRWEPEKIAELVTMMQ